MKIISKGRLKREQITNINEIEEVVCGAVSNFCIVRVDLENGRYSNIISYLDTVREIVTVSIQEIGMLTNKVSLEEIYHISQGEYGLEIVSDKCIDKYLQTKDMFNTYDKYQAIVDEIVLETFNINNI
ncbi:Uncharacterised protein [uncultured Clostridium sp.]|nr:Uncharacterised protein [uncultured Clostridium sp.]